MIWLKELARLGAIILWVLVLWTAATIVAREVPEWRIEVLK